MSAKNRTDPGLARHLLLLRDHALQLEMAWRERQLLGGGLPAWAMAVKHLKVRLALEQRILGDG